ncbi:hypothetical protein PWG14_05405 (plasmid) [Chromobacterium amazonense]|uniref:hypothetical protein n=1 Tax=Chromobacterium amazonense TaxID=1382803 RepID=UPI00237E01C5|nr:hypothetical protein [Chromobacterium amazonense]MDE1712188.1 hypothetical protein [Chromobacterium amazonense]
MHAIASLNRIRSHLALSWLAACLALASHAAPNPACPNGPLRVGLYKFGVAYRDGNGYDVEMVRELARRLHCQIASETELPRLRALKMLESGQIDLGTSTLATPDRLVYAWIFPYNHTRNMVLLHPQIAVDGFDIGVTLTQRVGHYGGQFAGNRVVGQDAGIEMQQFHVRVFRGAVEMCA